MGLRAFLSRVFSWRCRGVGGGVEALDVISPLPARAARAFSNNWLLSRMYVRKVDERHAPKRII